MATNELPARMLPTRGWLVAGLLAVSALVLVASAPAEAQTNKKYYLTTDSFQGNAALTACDGGFHMASFWEIRDTTVLKYDSTRGFARADSGSGPPSETTGWIRTGLSSSTEGTPGQGNCSAWTSNNGAPFGTVIELDSSARSCRPTCPSTSGRSGSSTR